LTMVELFGLIPLKTVYKKKAFDFFENPCKKNIEEGILLG